MPKTPQSPQMKLFDSSVVIRNPEKMALKPERVDTLKARKDLVSMGPTTSSTSNNLNTWLRDQTERTSISPTFRKPGSNEATSRTGIERPRIKIPVSMQGEIVALSSRSDRDSNSTIRTTRFPEEFIGSNENEDAERENGKTGIGVSAATRDKTKDLSRDFKFPFRKEGEPRVRGPGGGGGGGLPMNPRGTSGLPSNPRWKLKGGVRNSAAESVAFGTLKRLSRVGGRPSLVVSREGDGGNGMWPRASQVGRAS